MMPVFTSDQQCCPLTDFPYRDAVSNVNVTQAEFVTGDSRKVDYRVDITVAWIDQNKIVAAKDIGEYTTVIPLELIDFLHGATVD